MSGNNTQPAGGEIQTPKWTLREAFLLLAEYATVCAHYCLDGSETAQASGRALLGLLQVECAEHLIPQDGDDPDLITFETACPGCGSTDPEHSSRHRRECGVS